PPAQRLPLGGHCSPTYTTLLRSAGRERSRPAKGGGPPARGRPPRCSAAVLARVVYLEWVKTALTSRSVPSVRLHGFGFPWHAPSQWSNRQPFASAAVRLTAAPGPKLATQVG